MNKNEFIERVLTDPSDDCEEIGLLADSDPELCEYLASARALELRIKSAMLDVPVPDGLLDKLRSTSSESVAVPLRLATRNTPLRWIAIAACLLVAMGAVFATLIVPGDPTESDLALGRSAMRHVYAETADFAGTDNINFVRVSEVMSAVGGLLQDNQATRGLTITFAKPCLVLPGAIGAHLVIRGNQGTVNVILLNKSPVDREFQVEDERFTGMISPLGSGSMVLIGEKNEGLESFRTLLAANVDWVI